MSYVRSLSLGLSRPFSFSGRTGPWEFWSLLVACAILQTVATLIALAAPGALGPVLAVTLAFHLPLLSAAARRLHDADLSARWLLVAAVPLAGPLFLAPLLSRPGSPGINRFGRKPGRPE